MIYSELFRKLRGIYDEAYKTASIEYEREILACKRSMTYEEARVINKVIERIVNAREHFKKDYASCQVLTLEIQARGK